MEVLVLNCLPDGHPQSPTAAGLDRRGRRRNCLPSSWWIFPRIEQIWDASRREEAGRQIEQLRL